MKKLILIIALMATSKSYALETFACDHKEYKLKFSIEKNLEISLATYLKDKKIATCQLEQVSHEDNSSAVTDFELIRFTKKSCTNIYEKLADKVKIIDSGYFKRKIKDKNLSAYVIDNEQPIRCVKVKK